MLVQISKLLELHPVVGIVGRSSKVDHAKSLGCDTVIDKSSFSLHQSCGKKLAPAMTRRGIPSLPMPMVFRRCKRPLTIFAPRDD
jgi:NADPH-dependent curcumin reductase CurA